MQTFRIIALTIILTLALGDAEVSIHLQKDENG